MADLFNITLESGNLTGTPDSFDSAAVDGGDLSVDHAAALACTCQGLKLVIDDQSFLRATKNITAPASNEVRFRFYLDPNGLGMAENDQFIICQWRRGAPSWGWICGFDLKYVGGYKVRGWAQEDDHTMHATDHAITDEPHYLEMHVERGAGNGRVRFWVDGVLIDTWANLDNDDFFDNMADCRLITFGLDIGTSGIFYMDEFRANDDGLEIGPVAGGYLGSMLRLGVGGRKD